MLWCVDEFHVIMCLYRYFFFGLSLAGVCYMQYRIDVSYRLEAVWFSSNFALVLINVVALRRSSLVMGWVTICRWVNHLGMQSAQLSLAIPVWVDAVGTSRS